MNKKILLSIIIIAFLIFLAYLIINKLNYNNANLNSITDDGSVLNNSDDNSNDNEEVDLSKISELKTGFEIDNPLLKLESSGYNLYSVIYNKSLNNLYISKIVVNVLNKDESIFGNFNINIDKKINTNDKLDFSSSISLPLNENDFKITFTVYGEEF